MKKYTVLSVLALACLNLQAAELDSVRFAGYTTNAVPAGFSIVAVPFSGFNTNSFAITNLSLEALILTNGLSSGDRLIAFDEATTNYCYYAWTVDGWDPLNIDEIAPDSSNRVINALPLSDITKARGYAFWLKTASEKTVYLQGIANTSEAGVSVMAGGFTLIGNALPSPLELNSLAFTNANKWFTDGPSGVGDEIFVVSGTNYQRNIYFNGSWQYAQQTDTNTILTTALTIPEGSGVWYRRRGTNVTFKLQ